MTLRRYARYKDSGFEWLGEVPTHWSVDQLRRVIDRIEQGWSPECESRPADEGEWGVLKTGCVNGGTFNALENKALPSHLEVPREFEVAPGDLLMSRASGSPDLVGSAALVGQTPSRLLLSDKTFRLHVNERVDKRFLAWCLGSSPLRAQIECAISGAAGLANNLPQSSLLEFVAPVPPTKEQRLIASYLTRETAKIDMLIAEQKQLIELLTEKRKAVIAQATTKGLNPSAPMKDSGIEWLGEVPAHWDVSRLKFVAHVQTGVAKGKDNSGRQTVEVPYLRVANVQDGFLDLDEVSSIEIPLADLPRYRLQAGDVLMNEGGDFDKLGRGHVWDGSIDPCIHQNHVFAVRPFGISASWLNAVTGSAPAQFYFMSRSKQSTNLASISSTNIMELPVVIPPADEQESILRSITTRSAAFNELIEDARASVRLLRERRIAVISAAVTGQIDVRDRTSLDSALAETRADIAAGRYVVESAAAHVARAQAMARVDEQAPLPPSSC